MQNCKKKKLQQLAKKELRNLSKNAIISEEEFEQLDNINKGHYISVDEVSVNYLKSLIEKICIDLNDLDSTDYSSPLKVLNKIEKINNSHKRVEQK